MLFDLETAKLVCSIISNNLGMEWSYREQNGQYFVEIPSSDWGRRGLEKYLTFNED